ncbi:MAG: tRNA (adenosine(37)-N6)-threonylcarbamoyltransferase complex dimerization subunit type 1 TsaB [Planctomycetota bacterium]|jgi:tRNA threonylcarbamoyladenosine biosynthesis protein TsaB
MKPILAIETSGAVGSVALFLPDGKVLEREVGSPLVTGGRPTGHGRMLVPKIEEILAETGLAREQIGAVAVSLGPGSYTGIRIGVTAAKTLSWALGCELVGVPTLREAAALGVPAGTRRLVPAVDARRGEVYAGVFALDGSKVARVSGDAAIPPGEFAGRLVAGDHVFGTAVSRYREALAVPEGATASEGPEVPRAATVARLGEEMLARGETIEAHCAAPVYLRQSEAEMKREKALR